MDDDDEHVHVINFKCKCIIHTEAQDERVESGVIYVFREKIRLKDN